MLSQAPLLTGQVTVSALVVAGGWLAWTLVFPPMALPAAAAGATGVLAHLAFFPHSLSPHLSAPIAILTTGLASMTLANVDIPAPLSLLPCVPAMFWGLRSFLPQHAQDSDQQSVSPDDASPSGDTPPSRAQDEVEVRIAERTRQLAEANRRLRQKVEHLQASQATRIQMYRMLGHELRGPLTTMCSLVDVLVATLNGEEQKDAEVIRNQIDTLLVLVEDLLELARARDGSLSRSAERLDLAVLVQEEVEAQRGAVAEDVKFHLRLAPAPVEADRRDVERIITNLVGNAVKYTRRGVIAVTTGVEDGHTRFGVVDTGPGIPQDKLGSIFEPFAQVNGVDPREGFGSSGLGLAITKALVERAGGAISVKSQVGEGSAFRVRLPVADTLEVEK